MKKFSLDLFKALISENKGQNILMSPLSFQLALSMVLKAAKGNSHTKLREILLEDGQNIDEYFQQLEAHTTSLLKLEELGAKISINNILRLSEKLTLKPSFEESIKYLFNLEIDSLPETDEKLEIGNIIMAIINRLSIKATWKQVFMPHPFQTDFFYKEDGQKVEQIFMIKDHEYIEEYSSYERVKIEYLKEDIFHAVRIFSKDDRICLEIYLPYQENSLSGFLENLTYNNLDKWKNEFAKASFINVMLPVFEIDHEFKVSQETFAKHLNIEELFYTTYDYHHIFKEEFTLPLVIASIRQKSKIKLWEEGLEASSETIVMFAAGSDSMPEVEYGEVIQFMANRPFYYAVKDIETKVALFQGIYHGPKDGKIALQKRQSTEKERKIKEKISKLNVHELAVLVMLFLKEMMYLEHIQSKFLEDFIEMMIIYLEKTEYFLDETLNAEEEWEYPYPKNQVSNFISDLSQNQAQCFFYDSLEESIELTWSYLTPDMIKEIYDLLDKKEGYTNEILRWTLSNQLSEYIHDYATGFGDWLPDYSKIIEYLNDKKVLSVSPETIQTLKIDTQKWGHVLEVVNYISNYKSEETYTLNSQDIEQRLAYQDYRSFKTQIWKMTPRVRAALGAVLLEKASSFIGIPEKLLDFTLKNCWELISENEPSLTSWKTLRGIQLFISRGDSFDSAIEYKRLVRKVLAEIKDFAPEKTDTNEKVKFFNKILENIIDFTIPEKEEKYIYYPIEGLKTILFSFVKYRIPLPELTIFLDFQIKDDEKLGKPISKEYFISRGVI